MVHLASDGSNSFVIRGLFQDFDGSFTDYDIEKVSLTVEYKDYLPESWRRQERNRRHQYQRLIAGHQCEVEILRNSAIYQRYPALPLWWRDVEVPYGFLNVMPCIVTYSSYLFHGTASPITNCRLRSEWALSVATHLMYEVRTGRLWWIPFAVRKDIRCLGLHLSRPNDLDTVRIDRERLGQLLSFIDSLAWSKIPRDGSQLSGYPNLGTEFACSGGDSPSNLNGITPVYEGADWVIFDAECWCLHLSDDYFVEYTDAERGVFTPEHPRPDRVHYYRSQGQSSSSTGYGTNSVPSIEPRISRSRSDSSTGISPSFTTFLARQGITDMQSFLEMQQAIAEGTIQPSTGTHPSNGGGSSSRDADPSSYRRE